MHIEILVEDASGEKLLEALLLNYSARIAIRIPGGFMVIKE